MLDLYNIISDSPCFIYDNPLTSENPRSSSVLVSLWHNLINSLTSR